jgi:hypothetical protein
MMTIAPSVQAADLRVDFKELAHLVRAVVGSGKVRLHNAPGGLFDPGALITVGSLQKKLDLPVQSFSLAGGQYAFYVNDLNSKSIAVTPVAGAIRLTMMFEADGTEVVGGCVGGNCTLENVLPVVEWVEPGISVDFVPIRFNGSVSLAVKRVELLGTLTPRCRTDISYLAGTTCRNIALPQARKRLAALKAVVDGAMKKANDPEMQAHIANGLKPYLTLGPAGEVQVASVVVDAKGVLLSFRFAAVQ